MTIREFVRRLRVAYIKQLESTGAYTKVGMEKAFDLAVVEVTLEALEGPDTK